MHAHASSWKGVFLPIHHGREGVRFEGGQCRAVYWILVHVHGSTLGMLVDGGYIVDVCLWLTLHLAIKHVQLTLQTVASSRFASFLLSQPLKLRLENVYLLCNTLAQRLPGCLLVRGFTMQYS